MAVSLLVFAPPGGGSSGLRFETSGDEESVTAALAGVETDLFSADAGSKELETDDVDGFIGVDADLTREPVCNGLMGVEVDDGCGPGLASWPSWEVSSTSLFHMESV